MQWQHSGHFKINYGEWILMIEVWEVYEYLGSRWLRAICETNQEADEYIRNNSNNGVTHASGSYVYYLEKINR